MAGLERRFVPGRKGALTEADVARRTRLRKSLAFYRAAPAGHATAARNIARITKELERYEGRTTSGAGHYELVPTKEFLAFEKSRKKLEEQRTEVEGLALKRSRLALQGKLPIDEGLLKDLATQKSNLREALFRQLGAGFETSSAGIEALSAFERDESVALDRARRGDIAQFAPLGSGQRFSYAPPGAFLEPTAPFSQYYSNLAGGFGQAAGQLQDQRFRGFSAQQQGGGSAGAGIGSIVGLAAAGIGSFFTGGATLAAYAGAASAGAAAGGAIGGAF